MLDQTENPFHALTPLTVSTVSRITSAPVQAIKTWIQYGYITRPTKRGPTFHFAAKNVMEVAIMKTLCFDLGMRAKVGAALIRGGVSRNALRQFREKGEGVEICFVLKDLGLDVFAIGIDCAGYYSGRKVVLPMGRIWGEVLVRWREWEGREKEAAEREGRVYVMGGRGPRAKPPAGQDAFP